MSNSFPPSVTTFSFVAPLMETFNHVIDPEGDVVITLENPSSRFAIRDGLSATAPDQNEQAREPVTVRASSRHLKLASPVLKTALTGVWVEGVVTKSGYRRINTTDWDSEALRIVLNIIHGRNSQVPRDITLEMLSKLLC